MDHHGGLDSGEDGAEGVQGGYVTVVVGHVGEAVVGGSQVEDADGAVVGLMELADDVVTEESAATDDEDGA